MLIDTPDARRGTHIADGGFGADAVYYPDPSRIARINEEWETQGDNHEA